MSSEENAIRALQGYILLRQAMTGLYGRRWLEQADAICARAEEEGRELSEGEVNGFIEAVRDEVAKG